jgi:hypothetical protein
VSGAAGNPSRVAAAFALVGGALVVGTNLAGGTPSLSMALFTVWALVPYAALWTAGRSPRFPDPWPFVGMGGVGLAVEAGTRAAVFVFPARSTAAVALVFSPALVLLSFVPGALAGKLLGRAWRTGWPVLRAAVGIAFGAALALTVIALARPDILPTAVAARRAALKAIGEPRVAVGGDAFRKVLVSGVPGWHLAVPLDGKPGEEIAVVGARGADFYDAGNLSPRGRVDFGAGLRWSWFSSLTRVGGRVVVVQTGGGFSPTEVRATDGTLVWDYRPDPKLPPNALRAADLEGSGAVAFYAASQSAVARLDAAGKTVWSRPGNSPQLLALAPRVKQATAWVVTREYGKPAKVWDENGQALGEIPLTPLDDAFAVVDWPVIRGLVVGRGSARVVGLDGRALFEFPLAPMSLIGAESVHPAPDGKPLLALLAAGPRGVPRWRLVLLDAAGTVVYDEVYGAPLRLLKVRRADGGEALLLSSADGLRALR